MANQLSRGHGGGHGQNYRAVHLAEDELLLALKYELRFSKGGLQETVDELLILCQQTVFLYQMYHAGQGEHEA